MTTWIALLRGINVGGKNKLPMADLRKLAEGLGWQDVRSYIASGNLVFTADGDTRSLADALSAAISDYGLTVPVLVLSADTLTNVLADCPFDRTAGKAVHGMLLWSEPEFDADLYETLKTPTEEIVLKPGVAWLHAPDGVGRSKLFEKIAKVVKGTEMTGRNLNTLNKLAEMLD